MKSHTSKVPEFSFFWNLASLQRKKIKGMPYYSGNTAPEGRAGGKKMKKKNLQQNPLFYQSFVQFLTHVYVCLGLVIYVQTNVFLCTTLMSFCTQGVFSACAPDCPSFKINLQSKELTLSAGMTTGNVQMQMWECLEELLRGPEGSSKGFCCQEEISVWIFI